MDQNSYAPPAAAVAEFAAPEERDRFYVVGVRKFFVLYLLTFGLYQYVWSYKHWARLRARSGEPMWPVARSIFAIFFMHSLTEEVDQTLKRANVRHAWDPRGVATLWVVLAIASTILDRLAMRDIGSPTTDVLSLAMLMPLSLCMWRIQDAANQACGDPEGASNQRLDAVNWLWIALGIVVWAMSLLGLWMIVAGIE